MSFVTVDLRPGETYDFHTSDGAVYRAARLLLLTADGQWIQHGIARVFIHDDELARVEDAS